jgi:hypothetical protein
VRPTAAPPPKPNRGRFGRIRLCRPQTTSQKRCHRHVNNIDPGGVVSTWTVWDDETGDAEIFEYNQASAVIVRHESRVFADAHAGPLGGRNGQL